MTTEKTKRSYFLQRLLSLVVGFVIALGLGEFVVRMADLAPLGLQISQNTFMISDNPILKYELSGNKMEHLKNRPEKSPGLFRIIVLGDSVTYGSCMKGNPVRDDKTFPALLEKRLNSEFSESGKKFEVFNFGVPGYNTVQEAEYFRKYGSALDPDLIVIAYSLNDVLTESLELRGLEKSGPLSGILRVIHSVSALYRLLWKAFLSSELPREDWDIPKIGFQKIRSLTGDRVQTIVSIIPALDWKGIYPHEESHARVKNLALEAGFKVIDLFNEFTSVNSNFLTHQGRCFRDHPDERGHELMAETLAREVAASLRAAARL